jgi:hypothetical protein
VDTFLEIVAKGGAIVLCGYALWMINGLLIREKSPTKNELKLFWSVMAMTIVVIVAAIYMDTYRIRFQSKENSYRDAVANLWFEPYRGKYPMGTLNGLEWECSTDSLFNDFKGAYLVQRLWADASKINCWIRATQESAGLNVNFSRFGYGVDITIPPKDNKPRLVGNRRFLKVSLENKSERPVAFRIRIVDERGTQWAWAKEREETKQFGGEKVALDYKIKDSSNSNLELSKDGQADFSFSLERNKWEVFPHDGNTTMPSRASYFSVVQFVVIEFGSPDVEEKDKPEQHRRFLGNIENVNVMINSLSII